MNRLAAPAEPPRLDRPRRAAQSRLRCARSRRSSESSGACGSTRVGGDIVACYAHFLRTGDESLLGVVGK
jgi:hypothetical protein